MSRSDFYHLLRFRLEDALPRLLDRVLSSGSKAVVVAGSGERVEDLTLALWNPLWLPHGSCRDGHAPDQPIWLTDTPQDCPNGADVLILCDGMDSPLAETMARTLDLFDGNNPAAVEAARERWKKRLAWGQSIYYWQQDASGRWREKAHHVPKEEKSKTTIE